MCVYSVFTPQYRHLFEIWCHSPQLADTIGEIYWSVQVHGTTATALVWRLQPFGNMPGLGRQIVDETGLQSPVKVPQGGERCGDLHSHHWERRERNGVVSLWVGENGVIVYCLLQDNRLHRHRLTDDKWLPDIGVLLSCFWFLNCFLTVALCVTEYDI